LNNPLIVYKSQVTSYKSQAGSERSQAEGETSHTAHRTTLESNINHPSSNLQSTIDNSQSLIAVDRSNTIIETIKRAEDGNGVIIRLYESQRQRGAYFLTTNFPLAAAWRTNILEENQLEISVNGNQVSHEIKPYQIQTIRLIPRH